MCAMVSQITSLRIVYSIVYSGADQRKHQSSTLLAFVRGIHRWPMKSPHKGPVTPKMLTFDDVNIFWAKMKSITVISALAHRDIFFFLMGHYDQVYIERIGIIWCINGCRWCKSTFWTLLSNRVHLRRSTGYARNHNAHSSWCLRGEYTVLELARWWVWNSCQIPMQASGWEINTRPLPLIARFMETT